MHRLPIEPDDVRRLQAVQLKAAGEQRDAEPFSQDALIDHHVLRSALATFDQDQPDERVAHQARLDVAAHQHPVGSPRRIRQGQRRPEVQHRRPDGLGTAVRCALMRPSRSRVLAPSWAPPAAGIRRLATGAAAGRRDGSLRHRPGQLRRLDATSRLVCRHPRVLPRQPLELDFGRTLATRLRCDLPRRHQWARHVGFPTGGLGFGSVGSRPQVNGPSR